ncbi:YceH family protein [Shewanella sedimentimangrovi]|uniref:DUF480 domain-containing protein n=1 Tax=Shewanella sedimentimangrovi TaxID=2814293 RepID=A0ABX7R4G4_9GAMM|nr:DUF480 domain-containing protein [Shewanella sedimentimangrovi]QSX38717.1 DUF480 domain-containing protein [Shewanella sedimentimangrovi]
MQFNQLEARVMGCLLEKEVTTPDQYPLSLNALTLACNQKTSRDPVMELSETQVQATLDDLSKKRLISEQSGFGSRVVKYKHRFCNTEFGELQLDKAELAIICLLLLRGPQTAGELRSRSNRLYDFTDIAEAEAALERLAKRQQPLVVQMPREPGRRESRFMHLFADEQAELAQAAFSAGAGAPAEAEPASDRISTLEERVAKLEAQLQQLLAQQA